MQTNAPKTTVGSIAVKWIAMVLVVAGLLPVGGCRICADCEGLAYPAYGGAWQRTQRYEGRVGSLFDPGGAKLAELVDRDLPPDPDELERQRQQGKRQFYGPDQPPPEATQPPAEETDPRTRTDELRDRQLDDIEEEKEDELRLKELDDINVQIIPGPPLPPA